MQKSLVICGFPGVGKSYIYDLYRGDCNYVCDSDNSKRPWCYDTVTGCKRGCNPSFPQIYIDHIKSILSKENPPVYIFISTYPEVIKALNDSEIDFFIVFPKMGLKDEYMARYIDRGSPCEFTGLMSKMWAQFVTDCYDATKLDHCVGFVALESGQTMVDALQEIERRSSAVMTTIERIKNLPYYPHYIKTTNHPTLEGNIDEVSKMQESDD